MTDIKCTKDLARSLLFKQLDYTAIYASEVVDDNRYSDSDYDYLGNALLLSNRLLQIDYNEDMRDLNILLNADIENSESVGNYASDAVCSAFHDLKCASLDPDTPARTHNNMPEGPSIKQVETLQRLCMKVAAREDLENRKRMTKAQVIQLVKLRSAINDILD